MVREGLRRLIDDAGDMNVVGEAADGRGVLETCGCVPADVLLLDISMPGPGFVSILRMLREAMPHLCILVLSAHAEEQYAVHALREGAAGYLTKERDASELLTAIRCVEGGGRYVSQSLAEQLARMVAGDVLRPDHGTLSPREHEVLCLLGVGKSVKEIAAHVDVSPKTISTYRSRLLEKLSLSSTADLIRYAVEHELKP